MSGIVLPRQRSRNTHVETVVYETDRNNEARIPLDGITHVQPDWDIDRSGSKSRVDIATHKRVLKDGQWIAPHLRITPEVGEIVEQQLGHFRLVTPSTVVDGSVDEWGDEKVEQSATGGDIADLLADASLPFTFYTPQGGHVMTDIHTLIKMATCGMMGPNLLTNGGFENGTSGWGGPYFELGAAGHYDDAIPQLGGRPPEGDSLYAVFLNAGLPNGARVYTYQDLLSPPGASLVYLSAQGFVFSNFEYLEARVAFYDASGALITTRSIFWHYPPSGEAHRQRWVRKFYVMGVPDDAVIARVYLWIFRNEAGQPSSRSAFDDVAFGVCTHAPIPDNRINLPPSDALATTRIQTTGGSSIGYDAINDDRLAAIGHHAIYTDLTGRLTTSPSRDLGSATVARTYREDDYRLVDAFEVQRSANHRYNTVTAVKESFEEGVPPLFVTVWNDDANDPWSVHHLGNVRYPNGPLMVQDAVDNDALETEALAALARASMQHVLRITVLPDPTLTVHDVIEIVGGPEEAQGRWLVESLRPGTDAGDPVVEIGARRTLTSAGVSGVDMGGG